MTTLNSEAIRVLLAMPRSFNATRLKSSLSACSDFSIIGHAKDLTETFNLAETHSPAIVVISAEMTAAPEFEIMLGLFRSMNIRWVSFNDDSSRSNVRPDPSLTRSGLFSVSLSGSADILEQHLRSICHVSKHSPQSSVPQKSSRLSTYNRLVLIGSSTGGVEALTKILSKYPSNCPPTAIVQHTGAGFTDSLIRLLDRSCAAKVVQATDGMEIKQGMVCVAGGQKGHLAIAPKLPFRCQLKDIPPVSGHLPSVDVLFKSSAALARNIVGVLLTGMGQDGAEGLLELRLGGAITLAQDKQTSVVYGMPRVAFEMGAVDYQLPLDGIAPSILKYSSLSAKAKIRI